jgi:hypothetical protein
MAVRFLALHAGRPLSPRKIPGTHFCHRLSRPEYPEFGLLLIHHEPRYFFINIPWHLNNDTFSNDLLHKDSFNHYFSVELHSETVIALHSSFYIKRCGVFPLLAVCNEFTETPIEAPSDCSIARVDYRRYKRSS